jgi:hypothetical protein
MVSYLLYKSLGGKVQIQNKNKSFLFISSDKR